MVRNNTSLEQITELETVLSNLPLTIFSVNKDNSALIFLKNYVRQDEKLFLTKSANAEEISEVLQPELSSLLYQLIPKLKKPKDTYSYEFSIGKEDVKYYNLTVTKMPHNMGCKVLSTNNQYLITVKDITRQKQKESELYFNSTHDKLTGLFNRYYIDEQIQKLNTARQMPVSVVFLDLNGLKEINDTYGHSMGDILIKTAADELISQFRQEDIIARWGGDEFLVLLPKTYDSIALNRCKAVDNALKKQVLTEGIYHTGISFGVGTAEEQGKIKLAIEQAEKNMYLMKEEKGFIR